MPQNSPKEEKKYDFECHGKNGMYYPHAGTHFKKGNGLCTQCGRDYETCLKSRPVTSPTWEYRERETFYEILPSMAILIQEKGYSGTSDFIQDYIISRIKAAREEAIIIAQKSEFRPKSEYESFENYENRKRGYEQAKETIISALQGK